MRKTSTQGRSDKVPNKEKRREPIMCDDADAVVFTELLADDSSYKKYAITLDVLRET